MNARRFRYARHASPAVALGLALALSGGAAWSQAAAPNRPAKVRVEPPRHADDPPAIQRDEGPPVPFETPEGVRRLYKDKVHHDHKRKQAVVAPKRFESRPQQMVTQLEPESQKKQKKERQRQARAG